MLVWFLLFRYILFHRWYKLFCFDWWLLSHCGPPIYNTKNQARGQQLHPGLISLDRLSHCSARHTWTTVEQYQERGWGRLDEMGHRERGPGIDRCFKLEKLGAVKNKEERERTWSEREKNKRPFGKNVVDVRGREGVWEWEEKKQGRCSYCAFCVQRDICLFCSLRGGALMDHVLHCVSLCECESVFEGERKRERVTLFEWVAGCSNILLFSSL